MTEKLKPCPFCGGEAHISKMGYPHWIYCENCGAKVHGRVVGEREGEKASIDAWNRRTEQAGWIKTSERLPEEMQGKYFSKTYRPSDNVLVVSPEHGEWDVMHYSYGHKRWFTSDVRTPFAADTECVSQYAGNAPNARRTGS